MCICAQTQQSGIRTGVELIVHVDFVLQILCCVAGTEEFQGWICQQQKHLDEHLTSVYQYTVANSSLGS